LDEDSPEKDDAVGEASAVQDDSDAETAASPAANSAAGIERGPTIPGTAARTNAGGKPYSPGVLPNARITAYDFKRPSVSAKTRCGRCSRCTNRSREIFGASISGLLRTMLEVKLLSVDQLTYSEFVFSLDNPSCFNVIKPAPLEGHWVLDIAPSLAFAIIDRMLGGDPVPGETLRRPLTEIETRLMCRVVDLFLEQIVARVGKHHPTRTDHRGHREQSAIGPNRATQ